MATHVKKVSNAVKSKMQIFTDDTSNPNAVVFATDDLIDVKGSLGRDAKGCKVIIEGNATTYTVQFNYELTVNHFNESQSDNHVDMPVDLSNINTYRFYSAASQVRQVEFPFPISSVRFVAVTGTATATGHIHFIFW